MKITLYITPSCPYSKLTRDYFMAKGFNFKEVNIAENSEAAQEMVRLSGQMGVPVVTIDGHTIVGWNTKLLDEALLSAGQLKCKHGISAFEACGICTGYAA